MPKRRAQPPIDPVEKDFLDALERLKANKPREPELAKKAALGRLKTNISTVAKEANRSRTLIALDDCRYPNVRALILDASTPPSEARTAEDVIRNLRRENAELRKQLKMADSFNATLILRLNRLEKTAQHEIKAAERRARRAGNDPNIVAGTRLSETTGTIVPFPTDDDSQS